MIPAVPRIAASLDDNRSAAASSGSSITPLTEGHLLAQGPLEVFATMAAFVLTTIAVAHWVASNHTDRLALRLFSLRYLLGALGWFFVHPRVLTADDVLPLTPMLVAVLLLGLNAVALEVYLSGWRPRRAIFHAAVALGLALGVSSYHALRPSDPAAIYAVMSLWMLAMALMAWRASRTERNVGHLLIAGALLSYPLFMAGAQIVLAVPGRRLELSYVAALPSVIVGVSVLVASLVRFGKRLEAELQRRQEAERQLRELNAVLEQRVGDRTAELRRIVEGLEGFVRNVSHDLRGPLAGVAGVARLAEDALAQGDTARALRLLAPLAPQADRLAGLVHELLTLSRVTDGQCTRTLQPITPVVGAALEQLRLAPDSATAMQRVALRCDELPAAAVDASLLRQLYVNLIGNALRFAAETADAPCVRIGAERAPAGWVFFVADNGPGFPPEQASSLFKPFVRLHREGLSHNGIGLSIVQRVVERHGGRVWAELAPDGGAVFRFTLG